jgi:hypothetical protein
MIRKGATLSLSGDLSNLESFSCGIMEGTLVLPESLEKLKSLSFNRISGRIQFPKKLPMLEVMEWEEVRENQEVLDQLKAFKAQCEARAAYSENSVNDHT